MTKKELQEALTTMKVEFQEDATNAELKKLIEENAVDVKEEELIEEPIVVKKPVEEEDTPTDKVIEEVPQPEESKSNKDVKETKEIVMTPDGAAERTTTVINETIVEDKDLKGHDVYDHAGFYIRTYTKELHGKDAKKLAEGFAKKIKGIIK